MEWVIEPYETDGLTFSTPSIKEKQSMKFDGKDYPDTGPDVTKGAMSSGKRIGSHTIQLTDKVGNKVMDTNEMKVSADNKTIVMKIKPSDGSTEVTSILTRVK